MCLGPRTVDSSRHARAASADPAAEAQSVRPLTHPSCREPEVTSAGLCTHAANRSPEVLNAMCLPCFAGHSPCTPL